MLSRAHEDGISHIVSWQPHGRSFVVHEPQEFKKILPQYFMQSKLSSFQRQLNLYGFQRLTKGIDRSGYYNELFLRGRPDLAWNIRRVKVKGTGIRGKSNPEQEPDLWSMAWMPHVSVPSGNDLGAEDTMGTEYCDYHREDSFGAVSPTHSSLEEESDASSVISMPPLSVACEYSVCASPVAHSSRPQVVPSSWPLHQQAMPMIPPLQDNDSVVEPIQPMSYEFGQTQRDNVAMEWGMPFQYIDSMNCSAAPQNSLSNISLASPLSNSEDCIDSNFLASIDLELMDLETLIEEGHIEDSFPTGATG
jgi:hypothetical protein